MPGDQSKLRDFFFDLEEMSQSEQKSIDGVDQQIQELIDKRDGLQYILDTTKNDIVNRITPKGDIVYTFGNFYTGTLSADANLVDWQVFQTYNTDVTYISDTSFEYTGPDDVQTIFPIGMILYSYNGSTPGVRCTITGYDPLNPNIVIVEATDPNNTDPVLQNDMISVVELVYEYIDHDNDGVVDGWDNDPDILKDIQDFDFANDHIFKPLDINGTYGIQDRIDKLQLAKTAAQNNKTKYDNANIKYENYIH